MMALLAPPPPHEPGDVCVDNPDDCPICPECAQGKCVNCTVLTIDQVTDELVQCHCQAWSHS